MQVKFTSHDKQQNLTKNEKSFPSDNPHIVVLISVSLTFSQTPDYTARDQKYCPFMP